MPKFFQNLKIKTHSTLVWVKNAHFNIKLPTVSVFFFFQRRFLHCFSSDGIFVNFKKWNKPIFVFLSFFSASVALQSNISALKCHFNNRLFLTLCFCCWSGPALSEWREFIHQSDFLKKYRDSVAVKRWTWIVIKSEL